MALRACDTQLQASGPQQCVCEWEGRTEEWEESWGWRDGHHCQVAGEAQGPEAAPQTYKASLSLTPWRRIPGFSLPCS